MPEPGDSTNKFCGYCGRPTRYRVGRAVSSTLFEECPKWSSFLSFLKGDAHLHTIRVADFYYEGLKNFDRNTGVPLK